MHGVEVVPLAPPDKALSLKDVYDLFGETIAIHVAPRFFVRLRPVPIVGVLHTQVDGDGKAVHALTLGPFHMSPIEGPRGGFEILMETLGEAVQCVGDALQFEVDVMDGADPQSPFLLTGGPPNIGTARPDLSRSRAIHFEEERLIAHSARFKVHGWWFVKAVEERCAIISGGRVREDVLCVAFTATIIPRHDGAIAPDELVLGGRRYVRYACHRQRSPAGTVGEGATRSVDGISPRVGVGCMQRLRTHTQIHGPKTENDEVECAVFMALCPRDELSGYSHRRTYGDQGTRRVLWRLYRAGFYSHWRI